MTGSLPGTPPPDQHAIAPELPAGRRGAAIVRRPGFAEREPRRYVRRRRAIELGLAIGVPVVLVSLWQAASTLSWIDPRLYPSPTDIVTEGRRLLREADLWQDVWISVRRILIGYALGAGIGVAAGMTMGTFRLVRAALEPLLSALYTVPKLALLPVFLVVLGFGEAPIVAIIAVTVFFFVWISTLAAIIAVPEGYREAARSFGVNRSQMFRHVLLPAALPQVFVGLRIAAGVSVLVMVGVEFVIGSEGIGHVIEQGRTLLLLEQTYVGIVLTALLGLAFTVLVRWAGRLVAPWAKEEDVIIQR